MRQSVRSLAQTPRVFSASPRGLALDPRRWPRTEWPSAGVAEWQTQGTQNPPGVTSCGFESHLRHHHEGLRRPPNRPTSRRLSAPPAGGRKPSTRPLRPGHGRAYDPLGNGQTALPSPSATPSSGTTMRVYVAPRPHFLATRRAATSEWPYASRPPLRPELHQAYDPPGYGHRSPPAARALAACGRGDSAESAGGRMPPSVLSGRASPSLRPPRPRPHTAASRRVRIPPPAPVNDGDGSQSGADGLIRSL